MTRAEWLAKREEVKSLMKQLGDLAATGCGNGSCQIKKPTGMHTNGGCRCYREVAELSLRLAYISDEIKHIFSIPE